MKTPLRILFNDSPNNLPSTNHLPQGGPGRFATLFTDYFKKTSHTLISFFFSNNEEGEDVTVQKITTKTCHEYFQIKYPRKKLATTYAQTFTKKSYLEYLSPWIKQIEIFFDEARPDILFLNGYALTNYLLFVVAKKKGIPVCIQHAGIWKKEIMNSSGSAFSPSVRKIFIGFEKELINHSTHHVFLNTFSKEQFLSAHKLTEKDLYKSSIIPLPIPIPRKIKLVTLKKKVPGTLSIGAVSRWDAIKNHAAILRLAEYIRENTLPATVSVVTNPFNGVVSEFRDRYTKSVQVVAPMDPNKLSSFYLSCDVLILPSKFETLGGVVMEALIQGVPAIISNQVGWVPDYEKLGLMSLVVSPNASGKELFNAIDHLFKNPTLYSKKFATMQQKIIPRHLPEKVFPQYEKIFTNLSKIKKHV